jgi:hypothetical protein
LGCTPEAYCVTSNAPLSGLLTHMAGEGAIDDEKYFRTYLEHIYFEEDLDAQRGMVRNRSQVALLSEVTDGKLERAMRCREITSPSGLGYELLGVCSVGREQRGGICLIREKGRPDFDAREVTLLHRIIPHLSSGLKAAYWPNRPLLSQKMKVLLEYWSSTTGDKCYSIQRQPNDG